MKRDHGGYRHHDAVENAQLTVIPHQTGGQEEPEDVLGCGPQAGDVDGHQTQADDSKIPYDSGARIIVRVTWPAEIPYDARQKADYVLEVFKPIVQE